MNNLHFTQDQLAQVAKLTDADVNKLREYRGTQNRLGFTYQLCYVKLFNRLPAQGSFEVAEELATFVAVQLDISKEQLPLYATQKSTYFRHQEDFCHYLRVEKFNAQAEIALKRYLFQQALQIQTPESLFVKATEFLKEKRTLNPSSDNTIERIIQSQRNKARIYIFEKVTTEVTPQLQQKLDNLLVVGTETYLKLYQIKEVPQKPSAKAMKLLAFKLAMIEDTGALAVNLDWLNNNYKRYFSRYVTRCDANRLRELLTVA
jgi:hypothetical protein